MLSDLSPTYIFLTNPAKPNAPVSTHPQSLCPYCTHPQRVTLKHCMTAGKSSSVTARPAGSGPPPELELESGTAITPPSRGDRPRRTSGCRAGGKGHQGI